MTPAIRLASLMPGVIVLLQACSSSDGDAQATDAAQGGGPSDVAVDAGLDAMTDAAGSGDAPDAAADADAWVHPPNGPGPLFLPPSEPGRHTVTVEETTQVVPSGGLPENAPAGLANNNLDVVRHNGRVYLAWRAAPNHFASPEVVMRVVSSVDEVTWEFEAEYSVGADLREPRFLSLGDSLFLYMAELGISPNSFEPKRFWLAERTAEGTWLPLEDGERTGFIPWRARVLDGVAYLIGYTGGEHIYDFSGDPIDVQFLTTTDGRTLTPVREGHEVVSTGGGSEADFVITDAGELLAVIRNEAGDAMGFGSKICRAPASDITDWHCVADPRKYDSPLMFWYDGEAYLVGRRNLTETGAFDLRLPDLTLGGQAVYNQAAYSSAPKRCSIWRYDQQNQRIAFVLDLPSQGDTCFASVLETETPGEFVIYNYTSPLGGEEPGWRTGQEGPTVIVRHVVRFAPR